MSGFLFEDLGNECGLWKLHRGGTRVEHGRKSTLEGTEGKIRTSQAGSSVRATALGSRVSVTVYQSVHTAQIWGQALEMQT